MLTALRRMFSGPLKSDTVTLPESVAELSVVKAPAAPTHFVHFTIKEQVLFAKRLSFLVRAGVNVLESLSIIRNQTKNKRKRRIFDAVISDVAAGQSLAKSITPYRRLFGDFTVNMIHVGETAGVLPDNLTYLAEELSKRHTLQRKVRSALVYPAFITLATVGVTGMLVVFIFPKIMPIFISLNVALPWTTRALLTVSEFLATWGLLSIAGIIVFFIMFEIVRRTVPIVHYAFDYVLLKLPIAGNIATSYNCANFCRTLSLNIKSGMTLSESLYISADVTTNHVYKAAYIDFAQHIMRGEKISTSMLKYPAIFPDMLPHMILIGETTGSLSNALGYLSDLYETEVDEATKNLSNSIEPILLLLMGALVGVIAVSVIAPIYEVTKYLGHST